MTRNRPPASFPGEVVQTKTSEPDFAGLSELLGYRLRRAQGAAHREFMESVGDLKLTQKQVAVLWLVTGNPGVAQGAIGSALGMDRATMMALVDRLEERGLLVRRRSPVDARRRELHATAAGQRLLDEARRRIATLEGRLKGMFTVQELRLLEKFLLRFQSGPDSPGSGDRVVAASGPRSRQHRTRNKREE